MSDRPLFEYTASESIARITEGLLARDAIEEALRARIDAREDTVRAWCAVSKRDSNYHYGYGVLSGVAVGVKDIFDTFDLPTTWGTSYMAVDASVSDAASVALLRRAGARVLGKTVSTEFAYFTPGKTQNPHDPKRTPGGSSSGSAAAVADCMVPIALGTQTAGSITRPASYCGVIGYKPTFGVVPTAGVKAFAPSLDTVGWFARSVEDVARVFRAFTGSGKVFEPQAPNIRRLRIGVQIIPSEEQLNAEIQNALRGTQECLIAAGAEVFDLGLPKRYDELVAAHKTIMAYEAARNLASEHDVYRESMSAPLVRLLDEGLSVSGDEYADAIRLTAELGADFARRIQGVDAVLAPAAGGEAPVGHQGTGDPIYSRAWTLLGLPSITLPVAKGPNDMPIGLQLIAKKFDDMKLFGAAQTVLSSVPEEA